MFHKASGDIAGTERLVDVTISGDTLTFTASDLDISMERGDFVVYNKRFADPKYLLFKTNRTDRMRFASVPCTPDPNVEPAPGVHTYTDIVVRKPNWFIVGGTYFRGGPLVFGSGGWATLKVYS